MNVFSLSRSILGFSSAVLLGVVAPISMLLLTPEAGNSSAWSITMITMIFCSIQLSWLIIKGNRYLFSFIFWLFTYVFMGIAPSVQLLSGKMASTTPALDPTQFDFISVIVLISIITFWLGSQFASKSKSNSPNQFQALIDITKLKWLSVIAMSISLSYVATIGFTAFVSTREYFANVRASHWTDSTNLAFISSLAAVPILVAAQAWWQIAKSTPNSKSAKVIALILTSLTLFATNPVTSARYTSGTVWGSFLGPAGAYDSKNRTSWSMAFMLVGFLFIFPVMDFFRRDNFGKLERGRNFFSEYEGNGDYDAFGQIVNSWSMIQEKGLEFGHQFVGVFLFWVPRSIWNEKPVDTGTLIARYRGYSFENLSAPIWSELLVNFGVYGTMLSFFVIGFLLRRLDLRLDLDNGGTIWSISGAVLPLYLIILLRGSLLQATGWLVLFLLSLLLIRKRTKILP